MQKVVTYGYMHIIGMCGGTNAVLSFWISSIQFNTQQHNKYSNYEFIQPILLILCLTVIKSLAT